MSKQNPLHINTSTGPNHSATNSPNTPTSRSPHTKRAPAGIRGPGFGHTSKTVKRTTTTTTTRLTQHAGQRTLTAPVYEHGDETFGAMLVHPIAELNRHKDRVKTFQEKSFKFQQHSEKDMEAALDDEEEKKKEKETTIRLIIHFKRLTGDNDFKLTPEQRENIGNVLKFSEEEKVDFEGVNDADTLMSFFNRHHRENSTKIHTNEENEKEEREEKERKEKEEKEKEKPAEETNEKGEAGSSTATTPKVELDHEVSYLEKPKSDSASSASAEKKSIKLVLSDNMYIEVREELSEEEEDEEEEEEESQPSRRPLFEHPDPDLSDDFGEEKSASWLELFYDLFYIASLSQFTHVHHIVDLYSLGIYAGWFTVIWWSWTASSLYTSRYDTDDVVHHIYKLIEMCAVVGMAGASTLYVAAPTGFIIGYMVLKAVLIVEYSVVFGVAVYSASGSRFPLLAYVIVNIVSLLLWGISLLYTTNDGMVPRFVLWYLSIVLEVAVNIALKDSKKVSLGASHIAERFGLLTLIVLGENLMGFVKMVAESNFQSHIVVANMLAVVIIFSFFFMYFDDFSKKLPDASDFNQLWLYLHFPLHLCQVAFGISLTDMVGLYQLQAEEALANTTTLASSTTTPAASLAMSHVVGLAHAVMSYSEAATSSNGTDSSTEPLLQAGEEPTLNKIFVYRSFLVGGGLIMTINAFIKLIHTRVTEKYSILICGARIVNAIVFWGLVGLNYIDVSALTMIGVMTGCLLLQAMFDLLD